MIFEKIVDICGGLEKDIQDLKMHLTTGGLDGGDIPYLLSEEATSDGAANRDLAQFKVGFGFRYEMVYRCLLYTSRCV